jgi:hypothetical protein
MHGDPRRHVAGQLQEQARSCEEMGSPLYAALLARAADDVEAGGPCWDVLAGHVAPGRGDAIALRFMAAVHRLVLTGQAPGLARHYPSAGGSPGEGAWLEFQRAVGTHAEPLRNLTALPCQTNEVGRAAPLMFGFLAVAAEWGLPLRIVEVGASAGLNLRFDHFRYGSADAAWGDPASPVDLTGLWHDAPRHLDAPLAVLERSGCDRRLLDPSDPETRLALTASVWADQSARFRRLAGALSLAARVPARVERASLSDWLPAQLSGRRPGLGTVVYHSVVIEYLPADVRDAFEAALTEAGSRATRDAPLAWLRLEPISRVRSHGVTLTTWPGAHGRVLATSGAHGTDVRRADAG